VVQVFEFDQVDGQYYLAMELVRGRHLGLVVERAREAGLRLGLPRTLHLIGEAAKALAYVHRVGDGGRPLGLVHRDVSPHNLLLSFEGEVKLADFGIARAMSLAGLTEPGTLKGKIAYMAPEQAAGGPVDARADVFSLGVILWELCAGRRLFARDSEAAALAAVLSGPPPSPPSGWNEAVPPELDAIVLAALERDPARRTSSAEEIERALSALLLRMAQAPQDWDLRSFMHRLWPQGVTPAPAGQMEETQVRPPPGELPRPEAAAPAPETPSPEAADGTAATRTIARAGPAAGWRIGAAALAVAATFAIAGGVALRWRSRVPPRVDGDPLVAPHSPAPAGAPREPPSTPAPQADPGAAVPPGSGFAGPEPEPGAAEPDPEHSRSASDAGAPEPSREDGTRSPGVLYVNATPWARILVDGRPMGETPLTLSLSAGKHRVRAVHPSYGSSDTVIEIRAGRRVSWTPSLRRE
jgi:serine/threonine-protein kinase